MKTNPYVAEHHLKALTLNKRSAEKNYQFLKGNNEHLKISAPYR
jgi:hypothetical protein